MSRVRIAFLLGVASSLSGTGSAADANQSRDGNPAPPHTVSIADERSTPQRAISPETAAKLGARIATLAPTSATAASAVAAPDQSSQPEREKPRNTIIRLPEYIVRDPKVPPIKEREVLTPKARLELARKRHPGAQVGNFFGLNNGIALAMLAEEERLERKREFEDLASLTRLSDSAAHAKVKREVEQAFMRERDFGR